MRPLGVQPAAWSSSSCRGGADGRPAGRRVRIGDYKRAAGGRGASQPGEHPLSGNGYQIDRAAAIENMLLAATAMGLGSVWLGSYDEGRRCGDVRHP